MEGAKRDQVDLSFSLASRIGVALRADIRPPEQLVENPAKQRGPGLGRGGYRTDGSLTGNGGDPVRGGFWAQWAPERAAGQTLDDWRDISRGEADES
jgi:hypothetical protein